MDANTMYSAAMIGRDLDYQDDVIIAAWEEEGFAGLTVDDAQKVCKSLKGDNYSKCMSAYNSCREDTNCDRVAAKYVKAIQKGYKGTFEDFKKRSAALANIGQLSLSYLGDFLTNFGQGGGGAMGGGQDYCLTNPQDPICGGQQPNRTGLYVVLGLLAVAGIGAAIYFSTKKD